MNEPKRDPELDRVVAEILRPARPRDDQARAELAALRARVDALEGELRTMRER